MNSHGKVETLEKARERVAEKLGASIDAGTVTERQGYLVLPVTPASYPEDMSQFIWTLADIEIGLRDEGYRVRLFPGVRQRMIVVATVPGRGEIAYRTVDGEEWSDLARLLDVAERDLNGTTFEGYAFDSKDEMDEVVAEAKTEHPSAEFMMVA